MTLGLNSYFSTKNHIFISSFLVPAEINQFKPQFTSAVLTPTLVLCLKPHKSTFFYGLFSLFYTQTKAKSKKFWSISKNFSWNQIQHISQTITTPPCTLTTPFSDNHKPATHTPTIFHQQSQAASHRIRHKCHSTTNKRNRRKKGPKRMRSGPLLSIFLQITAYRLLN